MRSRGVSQTIVADSPDSASTVVHEAMFRGDMLRRADVLVIDAHLKGGTGGPIDVYLQRKVGANEWVDWIHFDQLSASADKRYALSIDGVDATIVEVGGGTDVAPGVALAAGKAVNVIPGDDVRIVFVAGAATSAGAEQSITITPYTERF